ncbi:MAG: type I asparaginase [Hyphomicrobiales bacterium]
MKEKTRILVIYTGGTIGMMACPKSGALKPFNFELMYEKLPMLKRFSHEIDFYSFDPLIDSSDMKPSFWTKLAEVIEVNYDNVDGFVILHGSDTMAYTASALSFMLEGLNKPVILTGSQLPIDAIRTDGRENFLTAIEIAASFDGDKPMVPEVCVYFESQLLRGNRTTKLNAENFNAFYSGNYPALAEAGIHIKYRIDAIRTPNDDKLIVHKNFDSGVGLLKLYPGISKDLVKSVLNTPNQKALILETFGSGNAPTEKWFIDLLEEAVQKGLLIFNITQCKAGAVQIGKYAASVDLGRVGLIGGGDITTESAITKLMYLLSLKLKPEEIIQLFQQSLRGEISS